LEISETFLFSGRSIFVKPSFEDKYKGYISAALISACLSGLSGCASQPDVNSRPSMAVLRSAEQGNPVAEYSIGRAEFDGATSSAEREKGLAKILHAANQNLAMAQDFMGTIYMAGRGVTQDTTVAIDWMNKAAEYGAPAAQLQLGNLYATGMVVPTDNARAYFWFSVLARPTESNVTIYNIDQLRAIATRRRTLISAALESTQRDQIDRRVSALSRLVWLIFTRSPVQQGATKDSLADA
jgi:hypothetical protein